MVIVDLIDPSSTVFATSSTNIHKLHFGTFLYKLLQIDDLIVESKEVQRLLHLLILMEVTRARCVSGILLQGGDLSQR